MLPCLAILLSFHWTIASEDPVLFTHIGRFVGKTLDFGNGKKVDAFYGVPFAKPPVGDLRFEKPQDAEFVAERQAKDQPNACLQIRHGDEIPMSEDCLYMNIFKPHAKSTDSKGYPGLFFVHGGAFQVGSAADHSTDYAAEHYAGAGLVYIVPQYRLNVFGFAATGPEQFAGNYGMWDLRRALLFVRKNAAALGADAARLSAGGYSAGAAAVSGLSLSEHTRDLFHAVLQCSGSALAEWATSNKCVVQTERVAAALGCDAQSSSQVKKCLKGRPARDLQAEAIKAHDTFGEINYFDFTPRLDADFFTADLVHLIESGKPKATLMTLTENEGLLFAIYFSHATEVHPHALTKEQKDNFTLDDFKNFVRKTIAPEKLFGAKAKEVQDKIIKFYLGLRAEEFHDRHFYLHIYAKVLGDVLFVVPQMLELRHKSAAGWPVFVVQNTHNALIERELAHLESTETTHGYEYAYLFGSGFLGKHQFDEADRRFRDLLVNAIVQFVKTRSPVSAANPHFRAVDQAHPLIYTELDTEARVKEPLFAKELQFWHDLTQRYDFDIIKGVHKKTLRIRTEL